MLTRAARRASPGAASELGQVLTGVDLTTAALLVTALCAYFHLANIAEQVHRADEWAVWKGGGGFRAAIDSIEEASLSRAEIEAFLTRLELRPSSHRRPDMSAPARRLPSAQRLRRCNRNHSDHRLGRRHRWKPDYDFARLLHSVMVRAELARAVEITSRVLAAGDDRSSPLGYGDC